MRRAIVVGSGGQDGRLLLERLAHETVEVVGVERPEARDATRDRDVDILDARQVAKLVADVQPDGLYYLAAHHASSEAVAGPGDQLLIARSHQVHVLGLHHCLEAIRRSSPTTHLFYAASSLVFGQPAAAVQDEATPLAPQCVYGLTKALGIACCRLHRRAHGLRASVGILYHHESPLRGADFVSQKIIRGVLAIQRGQAHRLALGDLSARVDWGYAPDFVDAMVRISGRDEADDFVVATGEAHTVREFVEEVFLLAGLDWRAHVVEDPARVVRRSCGLVGDSSKLHRLTGWRPSVSFRELIAILWRAAGEGEPSLGR